MKSPKPLAPGSPVKLIFTGGFLGSGKTTALAALARDLIQQGKRVGIITNDQSENLADTIIVRHLLSELGVPVEEVVAGCFCCKFDELIDQMEKILAHNPDILMGEPVGSCTDFVAAVANPIKIHYREAFRFAPFSTMVDPVRVDEFLIEDTRTSFPEEVSYLFHKQLEEADLIVLNKIDQLSDSKKDRMVDLLQKKYPKKKVMAVSAKCGTGMAEWLDILLSGGPGADTVLHQIDYDRYARAEAVLGWLNAAVKITADRSFDYGECLRDLAVRIRDAFREINAGVGHLKFVMTCAGKSMWINLTHLAGEPVLSDEQLGDIPGGSLIVNARVQIDPGELESIVRNAIEETSASQQIRSEIIDLQCFSPAYPNPPYLVREEGL
jgi:Ni2+-binding GTPase involved in maturation of urease and hydrogenase